MDIIKTEDHGMWRGHRSWTVTVEDEEGRAAVSVRDVDNEADAIAQARETRANRVRFTEADKAALAKQSEALRRVL